VLVVKSKEQALAMADALTAPANAKRRQQVERRQQRLFGHSLSAVPVADQPEVQKAARRYAARRWWVYVPYAVVVTWLLLVQFWPPLLGARQTAGPRVGMLMTAMMVTLLLQTIAVRSYVSREAEKYRMGEGNGGRSTNV
jgi:hypothetical protein